jgi:proline iminopeptidase
MMTSGPGGERRGLYPEIEPYQSGTLAVSDLHQIHFEQSGNPAGKPVVFLHGGPGGGCEPRMRRFFDPNRYRIVLFDQRGSGKSTPHACLEQNTTWDLVSDIEQLREHLGIERWQVFGGSWGSTLALAYAEKHPSRVSELVLRGIFLLRRWELDWFYQEGASRLFPDTWAKFLEPIPLEERSNLMNAYHQRLLSPDAQVRTAAAKAWSVWEASTSFFHANEEYVAHAAEDDFALAFARIECHYFQNRGFFQPETQLLDDARLIRHVPCVIVHGRYDVVCPLQNAWDLERVFPEAELEVVHDAGHSAFEPGNTDALVRATDRFARA